VQKLDKYKYLQVYTKRPFDARYAHQWTRRVATQK